jgi:hypothetical protein
VTFRKLPNLSAFYVSDQFDGAHSSTYLTAFVRLKEVNICKTKCAWHTVKAICVLDEYT